MEFKTYTLEELERMQITKRKLAQLMGLETRPGLSFDYALPQGWLDDISSRYNQDYYHLILSTTFWVYCSGEGLFGAPVSGCAEVQALIQTYEKESINGHV